MRIAIVGDSWADPGLFDHLPSIPCKGYSKQGHIDGRLRARGYTVGNFSRSGASNLYTWRQFAQAPRETWDWIIWFHTELSRDWNWPNIDAECCGLRCTFAADLKPSYQAWNYSASIEHAALTVYSEIAAALKAHADSKLMVVEAQSVCLEPQFSQWITPHYWLRDWRSELVGRKLPASQLITTLSSSRSWCRDGLFFDRCQDHHEVQFGLLAAVEENIAAMDQSPWFVDRAHPGDRAYAALFDRIQPVLEGLM